MRRMAKVAASGLMLVACSARYEVGGMDENPAGAPGGSSGVDTGLGSPVAGTGSSVGLGGTMNADPGQPVSAPCAPSAELGELPGPYAEPELVWSRISHAVWADRVDPPTPLPSRTTSAWATAIADRALDDAVASGDGIPGADNFVRLWLELDQEATLLVPWGKALATDARSLDVLLRTPLGEPNRRGIFAEPSWLAAEPSIPGRGYLMARALFAYLVPSPPPDSPQLEPMPGTTRRQALVQSMENPACAGCHRLIDPLGFSLEHFDELGDYRALDAGQQVDASGTYQLPWSNKTMTFRDFDDLAQQVKDGCDANAGLASEFLRLELLAERGLEASYPAHELSVQRVQREFLSGNRSYRSLVKAYARSPAVLWP